MVAPKKCLYRTHCTNPAEKLGVIWRLLQSMEVLLGWRANIYSVNTKICMKFKYITYDCSIRVSVHVVLEVSLIVSPQREYCARWARHGVVMGSAPSHLPQLLRARQVTPSAQVNTSSVPLPHPRYPAHVRPQPGCLLARRMRKHKRMRGRHQRRAWNAVIRDVIGRRLPRAEPRGKRRFARKHRLKRRTTSSDSIAARGTFVSVT